MLGFVPYLSRFAFMGIVSSKCAKACEVKSGQKYSYNFLHSVSPMSGVNYHGTEFEVLCLRVIIASDKIKRITALLKDVNDCHQYFKVLQGQV